MLIKQIMITFHYQYIYLYSHILNNDNNIFFSPFSDDRR